MSTKVATKFARFAVAITGGVTMLINRYFGRRRETQQRRALDHRNIQRTQQRCPRSSRSARWPAASATAFAMP